MPSENVVRMQKVIDEANLSMALVQIYERMTLVLPTGTEIPLSPAQITAIKADFAASRVTGRSEWAAVVG